MHQCLEVNDAKVSSKDTMAQALREFSIPLEPSSNSSFNNQEVFEFRVHPKNVLEFIGTKLKLSIFLIMRPKIIY